MPASNNPFMNASPDAGFGTEERFTVDEFLFWAHDCGLVDFDYDDDGVSFWYFVGPEPDEDEHECPECTKPHSPRWAVRLRAWLGLPRRR